MVTIGVKMSIGAAFLVIQFHPPSMQSISMEVVEQLADFPTYQETVAMWIP
jgi:hypothetical protein